MARKFSGQLLRAHRLAAGLKPEHVAIAVDRSTFSVREYELGRVTPPVDMLGTLADFFGCPVDDFFATPTDASALAA
jgi:transcriptional regulator with XRE-family HTH domain